MRVTFNTANAAFEDDRRGECARILREVAEKVTNGEHSGNVRDINGNTIGTWAYGPKR